MNEPMKIWIVEDNRPLREVLRETLAQSGDGWEVSGFASCEDALEEAERTGAPKVVLMDLGLPGMSGLEGITRIRSSSVDTEVVVFTVFDDAEKVYAAVCAGASGYLLKSEPPGRVIAAIREVLAGGSPMHPQVARKVLDRLSGKQATAVDSDVTLSDREREVLECMTEGQTKKEIAERLDLSIHTVDNYLRRIYRKLHVNTMQGAVAKALKEGLV